MQKNRFPIRPPANRLAEIEGNRQLARLTGSTILVVLALAVLFVALVIVLQTLPPAF